MKEVSIVGLDLAKRVFQVHAAGSDGSVVLAGNCLAAKWSTFFRELPRCTVPMEACATAHYWAREIGKLGHEVRLIPPAYVKPFVKQQKNDAADAEAIVEAATRPSMRFVSSGHGAAHHWAREIGRFGHTVRPRPVVQSGSPKHEPVFCRRGSWR